MKTLTQFFNPFLNESQLDAKYEVIENMIVNTKEFRGLSISGSLFSLTTFKNVTFESCVFYGSKIENCKFINCKFIDCEFKFTNVSHSNFTGTTIENCKWDYSPIKKTEFNFCHLCAVTMHFSSLESNNTHSSCTSNIDLTWDQALKAEKAQLHQEKSTQKDENFSNLIENFLFGKQAA